METRLTSEGINQSPFDGIGKLTLQGVIPAGRTSWRKSLRTLEAMATGAGRFLQFSPPAATMLAAPSSPHSTRAETMTASTKSSVNRSALPSKRPFTIADKGQLLTSLFA